MKHETKLTLTVKNKIKKIQTDMINSKGLDDEEAQIAVKIGLLDEDQAWWWKEHWQKGEREAEKDIKEGRVSGPFDNVEDLMKDLNG